MSRFIPFTSDDPPDRTQVLKLDFCDTQDGMKQAQVRVSGHPSRCIDKAREVLSVLFDGRWHFVAIDFKAPPVANMDDAWVMYAIAEEKNNG